MKKLAKAALAVTMAASLVGCSSSKDSGSKGTDATGTKKIALVTNKVGTNAFLTQMIDGLKKSAEDHGFDASNVECSDTSEFSENIRAYATNSFFEPSWYIQEYESGCT